MLGPIELLVFAVIVLAIVAGLVVLVRSLQRR